MSKKKQALIEHAEQLFYDYGFHATGLKRIIQEADVALMTLYNHFASKEELILEVLKNRERKYFSILESEVAAGGQSVVYTLAEAHCGWIREHDTNGCMFLRAKEEFSSSDSHEIVRYVDDHKKSLLEFFERQGISRSDSVQLVILFEGATASSETLDIDDVVEAFMRSIKMMDLEAQA